MPQKLPRLEANLRKAGYLLLLETLGAILLGVWLSYRGLAMDLAVPFVWLCNLPAAWFLAQAARHQGRNAWFTGITSIPPLLALANFLMLLYSSRRTSLQ